MEAEQAAFVLVIGAVLAGFVFAPPLDDALERRSGGGGGAGQPEGPGDPGSAHIHAQLFFAVNGSQEFLAVDSLRGSQRAHFHGNDSILHVHAENVDVGFALQRLGVGLNRTCLTFDPEGERFCGGNGNTGLKINGEAMDLGEALERNVRQEDRIVVWFGEEPEAFESELPPEYREEVPGRSV